MANRGESIADYSIGMQPRRLTGQTRERAASGCLNQMQILGKSPPLTVLMGAEG